MLSLIVAFASALLTFSLAQGAYKPECCASKEFALFPPAQVNFTTDTIIELNNGWQPFFFGSDGTWAVASNTSGAFYTNFRAPVVIRITDAYQTGDRFALYLNGTFVGNTTVGTINSTTYTTYPSEAWVQANYSHGEWLIPTGLQRLTIKVLNSVDPRGSGAFIRADVNQAIVCGKCRPFCKKEEGPCKCFPVNDPQNPPGCCANNPPKIFPICKEASGMFTLIKGQFTRDQGIAACAEMNLRLAEINSANFDGVNQFCFACNGNQVTQSWIRSWNGDNYENACLVLSSGSFGGTGAINAQPCQTKNYVLCQA